MSNSQSMRHYEIMILVHPDQSAEVPGMIERYRNIVLQHKGVVHRQEDIGRLQLAYPIDKINKAHYILFNVQCDQPVRDELENSFRFNDAIVRYLIERQDGAITEPSPLFKNKENKDAA